MKLNFINCIKGRINKSNEIKEKLYSLILYGSIIRGDFINGVSDIDFFAVLKEDDPNIIEKLRAILEECCENINAVEVDLAWGDLENIRDPINKGYPFKFLTIYQDDFLKYHKIIYGNEIKDILPRYDWKKLVKWRVKKLLSLIEERRKNPKMLHISAGEIARLLALLNGAKSLSKNDILNKLKEMRDGEALEIYKAYLNGRKLKFKEEYLVNFITSRIKKILKTPIIQ